MQVQIKDKDYKYLFYGLLFLSVLALIFMSNTLSISYKEALNVLDNKSILTFLTMPFLKLFPGSDVFLRLPFIIFYTLSSILMYLLTKDYFKYESDRFINIFLFMLLPGILSAAILVNTAIIVLFFTLLYLYYYKTHYKHNYYILLFCLLLDNSFAILYLALFFYGFENRDKKLISISLFLFILSMSIYGFDSGGRPKGHFLDTFAIYASVFSPLLFLYFFYSQYRIAVKGTRSIYWYIPFVALIFSLLFSFRQKVYIEDFAPFVIIAMPLMVKLFLHTYRVRLAIFRKMHYLIASSVVFILLLNYNLVFFNNIVYLFLDNPKKHFIFKHSFVSDLADKLKENNINNISSPDKTLIKRLEFYGINEGSEFTISNSKEDNTKYLYVFMYKYDDKKLMTYYIK